MLEMYDTIRTNSPDQVLVVAGGGGWAYDASSLVDLDKKRPDENLVMYNYHPYMGADQQGDQRKSADGFEAQVKQIFDGTDKPISITEFGQFCCDTDGGCFIYPGKWSDHNVGYAEAILLISQQYNLSWFQWAWRPGADDY